MSVRAASLPRPTVERRPESPQVLRAALADCRGVTLARIADLDDAALRAQPDPNFSPIGWHLGHLAYTETLWLDPGRDPHPEWQHLFRQDGLPKAERRNLPTRAALEDYLSQVRGRVLAHLDADILEPAEFFWHFIAQHESQHAETIAMLRRLLGVDPAPPAELALRDDGTMIEIPAGRFLQGLDSVMALDNERASHIVELGAFRMSAEPVSQGRFRRFIEAGGYRDPSHWSEEGWRWRCTNDVARPLHWIPNADHLPVHGVSAYEAEAYCRSIGARLPSESEWERAATFDETGFGRKMLGQVWQWTATGFAPYAGFTPFPYPGYSTAYFDGRHRVLKGGSWATGTACLRVSFRNWYEPWTRQIFAGFRYAQDV